MCTTSSVIIVTQLVFLKTKNEYQEESVRSIFVRGMAFSIMLHVVKKQKMTRSGGKLPDLLKTERESCSPVTLQMKVNLPQSVII